MQQLHLIPVNTFCVCHNIEDAFLSSLHRSGLIQLIEKDGDVFIVEDQIGELERYVRLRYDLDINLEGIEALTHLLQKVETMQEEIIRLRNFLQIHEG